MPSDPTLYLYTSLTAGSSHIITATSRAETILKANKIPFKAVDIATDEKARLIWQRRSKGRKIPGLVKYNDVIADYDQIEEWNEYGELEDQIEDAIDIFGDVPVSATSAEAQAAGAVARANASRPPGSARTASELRHISISDPRGDRKKSESAASAPAVDSPSPMNMAMRQAGMEAAAKAAGQKKTVMAGVGGDKPTDVTPETRSGSSSSGSSPPATLPESQEPSSVTDAKTPGQLASEGAAKTSTEKIANPSTGEDATSTQSTLSQTLSATRKASVPNTPSSLSKSTSISESHTVSTSDSNTSKPPAQHRGSDLDVASAERIREVEKRNSIAEEDEEDEESSEEESEEEEDGKVAGKTGVGATDKGEKRVMGGETTQEMDAKDGDKAGVSVGD